MAASSSRIYLDYAASAPLRPAARARMVELLEVFGNPSSIHAEGQTARMALDDSRRAIADVLGVRAERVVFTSGGTEANNLALRGVAAVSSGKRLLVSAIEHDCVRNTGLALGAEEIPVDAGGLVRLDWLRDELARGELARGDVALVSVMHANNENGILQPIEAVAAMCKAAGVVFHTDAVQTVGHLPVDVDALGADLVSFAAHKFGGPRGVGALVLKPELEMLATITGGAQERNRRAGTENVAAIGGAAAALAEAISNMNEERMRARAFNELVCAAAETMGLRVVGKDSPRVEHVVQLLTPKNGSDVVIGMDLKGVAISQGSACGSGKVKESHVLRAMGFNSDEASRAVRVSWGWGTTEAEIRAGLAALRAVCI